MNINDLDYHFEDDGDRTAEPLLLLHGFTGSTRSWDGVASVLAEQRRVIRVDLPGHGQTAFSPVLDRYSMASVANDLGMLLTNLDASSAHVLGYSMGSRLALFFALTHPQHVRKLIVESGSPGLTTEAERDARRASDEELAQRIERDDFELFVDEWEKLPLWRSQTRLPDESKQRQRAIRLGSNPRGLALSLRGMGTGAQPSVWDALPSLQMPTLLIAGELDDKFVGIAREMQTRASHTALAIIADAGHATHLEQPKMFVRSVISFLESEME